jgi:hypothetical protein
LCVNAPHSIGHRSLACSGIPHSSREIVAMALYFTGLAIAALAPV